MVDHNSLQFGYAKNLQTRLVALAKTNYEEYKEFARPNGFDRHTKSSDALKEIMCPQIECKRTKMFHWCCVLGRCKSCPILKNHHLESGRIAESDDMVDFEHYVQFSRCTKHGLLGKGVIKECSTCRELGKKAKLSHKKERTKDKKGIEDFMFSFYKTMLENTNTIILTWRFCLVNKLWQKG